jgi:hypothetical protein
VTALDARFVFGRTDYLDGLKDVDPEPGSRYRYFGIMPDSEWQTLNVSGPAVEKTRDGFLVKRCLFRLEEHDIGTHEFHVVSERVAASGRLERNILETRAVPELLFAVPWED